MTRIPSPPMMIPIKSIDFFYNVRQSAPDLDQEKRTEQSIKESGLFKPIKVRKIRNNRFALIGGATRIRIFKHLHSQGFAVRFAGTGVKVPVGKIPAIESTTEKDEDCWFEAVTDNWDQRQISPFDMGAHLHEIVKRFHPEYYEAQRSKERQGIVKSLAQRLDVQELEIYEWLRSFENAAPELKESLKKKEIGARQYKAISRLGTRHMQKLVLNRVKKTGANTKKTNEYVSLCQDIEQAVPAAKPEEREEAVQRYIAETERRRGNETVFEDIMEMPFMRSVHVNVKSLTCPPNRIRLTSFPCQYERLTDDEKKRCEGFVLEKGVWVKKGSACIKRNQDFDLGDWRPKITLWIPAKQCEEVLEGLQKALRERAKESPAISA